MDLGLKDSHAVVTGGSKGMGRSIALAFAEDGANVAVLARGQGALDETVEELRDHGSPDALGLSVDLSDPEAISDAFATIGERWGAITSLVNTVGPSTASSKISQMKVGPRPWISASWRRCGALGRHFHC